MKIMVVKDVEREDIEHVCKSLGCAPVASLDHFTADKLASADLVEQPDVIDLFQGVWRQVPVSLLPLSQSSTLAFSVDRSARYSIS